MKKIFIVAGEHSGDALGGPLMAALKKRYDGELSFQGVGGDAMEREGLRSLFPLSEIAVMGPIDIAKSYMRIRKRAFEVIDAAIEAKPDIMVIIDSPEFTHPIAKRVRKVYPDLPVINYVSPSVWAWRSGRAKKMKPYVDHVLALLPFEPEAHERLGGPKCTYVGHPMIEKKEWMQTRDVSGLVSRLGIDASKPVLVVLPGSRPNEVKRLMEPFGKTVKMVQDQIGDIEVIIPVVKSVEGLVIEHLSTWPFRPHLVYGDDDKFAAFATGHAALAASGTVTLELALAGMPMVVGYKADWLIAMIKSMINVQSIVLANLILKENVFPEHLQEECTAENMARDLIPLMTDTDEWRAQQAGLSKIADLMYLKQGTPSDAAAKVVLEYF